MVFWLVTVILPFIDVLFWYWGDRRLRPLRRAYLWRILFGLFMGYEFGGLALMTLLRVLKAYLFIPMPLLAGLYLWHMLVLPATLLAILVAGLLMGAAALLSRIAAMRPVASSLSDPADPPSDHHTLVLPTRRQVLVGAALAIPPILTAGSVARGLSQVDDLRLRRMTIRIPSLPPALAGLTIAHVTDVHTGWLTGRSKLASIVQTVNGLDADLVAVTGDLIDFRLNDLPLALEMVGRFNSRHGTFICEGNHDLFVDREGFEEQVKKAGFDLLLDETRLLRIRNQNVQVLGIKWGDEENRNPSRNPFLARHMGRVLADRRTDAFPILLAHHPEAFDHAIAAGLPLTLAGHTHGGQLMITPHIGPGPLFFKYWSGLYRRQGHALVVSNGCGNWFPLRINAPAEVIHITLRLA